MIEKREGYAYRMCFMGDKKKKIPRAVFLISPPHLTLERIRIKTKNMKEVFFFFFKKKKSSVTRIL